MPSSTMTWDSADQPQAIANTAKIAEEIVENHSRRRSARSACAWSGISAVSDTAEFKHTLPGARRSREPPAAARVASAAAEAPDRHSLALGAYADDTLVAVLLGSLPGTCLGCERNEDTDPWSTEVAAVQVAKGQPANAADLDLTQQTLGRLVTRELIDELAKGKSMDKILRS